MSNKKQTTNIDFDIFENDQVFETATDADRLVDNSIIVPSDDQLLARSPFLSVSLPVDKNSTNASADGYQMIRGYRNLVKQNFKNLMLTSPGEKIMDPLFGVGVKRYLFELKQLGIESKLKGRIHSQTRKYLSYITIRQVNFNNPSADNKLNVHISYFINPLNIEEFFNYSTNTKQSL